MVPRVITTLTALVAVLQKPATMVRRQSKAHGGHIRRNLRGLGSKWGLDNRDSALPVHRGANQAMRRRNAGNGRDLTLAEGTGLSAGGAARNRSETNELAFG